MHLGRALERWWRERRLGARARRLYGTRFPDEVVLPETGIRLSIDPRDPRARKQVLFDGLRGRVHRNARFWREACSLLGPDLCLDVGANFGECGLGCRYESNAKVLVLEANPALMEHLERTHAMHPDADQIQVIHALVGASDALAQPLYVNRASTGRSTAVASITDDGSFGEAVMVPMRSIDSLLAERAMAPARMVFKVDVEGFEPAVMAGMAQTLARCEQALGYVELDTDFLERAGWSLETYDRHLAGLEVYIVEPGKRIRLRRVTSLANVGATLSGRHLHTDMVLVRGDVALPSEWLV